MLVVTMLAPIATAFFVVPAPPQTTTTTTRTTRPRRRESVKSRAVVSPAAVSVASTAVLRLTTVCGLGAYYARAGVLDAQACTTLSRLVYHVFQPAMLFVNCASTIWTTSDRARLLALPTFAGLQIAMGAAFGAVALRGKPASIEARELRALCAFGNAGPLPFVFAEGFFEGEQLARAVAYISFYLVGWSPLFWTIGPLVLNQKRRQRRFLSPPVVASILGVVAGSNDVVAAAMFRGIARPLTDSLRLLGSAYLPAVALVLSGTLARALLPSLRAPANRDTPENDDDDVPAIALATRLGLLALCRFVWLPVATVVLLHLGTSLHLLADDPLLRFVILMAASMPSAQNAIVILQLSEPEDDEAAAPSMARLLALLYLGALVPMAVLLSIATKLAPLDI
ncbi:hypothetical protein CTAYLR_010568 [Chrysophaeum taylorii]|uniref:Auxin efflux carrier n=1 Tax=Chrysophaeum taylorii TaxID=2483200 RepID=A0AAD7UAP0_9STRA|nr:hypothetical protein CTAYLR_010568 [Chrysophaeum taylorii]